MAGETFIAVPKDLKDEVSMRRLFEAMIKEIDKLKVRVTELGG